MRDAGKEAVRDAAKDDMRDDRKIGLYPGSFDPFTVGHLDVLRHASLLFDRVYVSILRNSSKQPVFSEAERVELIRRVVEDSRLANVEVLTFDGLTVEHARELKASYLIRGLRAITDFEYEFSMDALNRHLAPEIQTVYFMARPEHSFLSSSKVREIGSLGGSIGGLVPACIEKMITERLAQQ